MNLLFIKDIKYLFLLFLLIFSPSLPFVYSGAFLAGGISFLGLFLRLNSFSLFKNRYIFSIFVFLFCIIVFSLLIATLNNTYDISIVKTFINQFFNLISTIFVFIYIITSIQNTEKLKKLIFYTFALQTISILFAMMIPQYHEIVLSISKFPEEMINYRGGIRTYSLASSNFFGLGATFGLIYLLFLDSVFRYKWLNFKYFIVFILLIIGTFFIARTGFIGLVLALLMIFVKYPKNPLLFKSIIYLCFLSSILSVGIYFILPENIKELINTRVLPFAFELFMQDNGTYSTTSTDTLISMWKIPISLKTFLIGDGWYTSFDGKYYMEVDAGYLRNILFGGISYFIILLLYQIYFFTPIYKKSYKLLFYFLLLYMLLLHIKGEVIGFLIIFQKTLFLFLLSVFTENNFKHFNQ